MGFKRSEADRQDVYVREYSYENTAIKIASSILDIRKSAGVESAVYDGCLDDY